MKSIDYSNTNAKNLFKGKSPFVTPNVNRRHSNNPNASDVFSAAGLTKPGVAGNTVKAENTTKDLMHKKLYLMKQMLKNEKRANDLIQKELGTITKDVHLKNQTAKDFARLSK